MKKEKNNDSIQNEEEFIAIEKEDKKKENETNSENSKKKTENKPIKKVFIGNLNETVTNEDLENHFGEIGPIKHSFVVKKAKDKEKCAGIGFVVYSILDDATECVKKLNNTPWIGKSRKLVVKEAKPKKTKPEKKEITKPDPTPMEISEEEDESKGDESESEGDESEGHKSEEEEDESEEDEDESEENEDESEEDEYKDDVEEGRTIFVTNLSFETVQREVFNKFVSFGFIELCVLVQNNGVPKGTAFIKYKTQPGAERAINAAQKNEGIMLSGRHLSVMKAINKDKIEEKKKEDEKKKESSRNLHLAKLATITEDEAKETNMTKIDIQRRQLAESEKNKILRNPNYYLSDTRLSLKNIPVQIDEKKLKVLLRENSKFENKPGIIKQLKIVTDSARLNKDGKPRSKGYGFVEFRDHKNALACLKNTNNNEKLFPDGRRLIVDFAIENKTVIDKRKKKDDILKTKEQKKRKRNEIENENTLNKSNKKQKVNQDSSKIKKQEEIKNKQNQDEKKNIQNQNEKNDFENQEEKKPKRMTKRRKKKNKRKKNKVVKQDI